MNIQTKDNDLTKKLTKWMFSWNFFGFIIYCTSVVITVGIVLVGIFYLTDILFHTNILPSIAKSHCGNIGGVICVSEKLIIKIIDLRLWLIIIIPILIVIIGSRKYDKKYD